MSSTVSPAVSARRRVALWVFGGLLIVALAVGVFTRVGRSSLILDEAEAALQRNDPIAARSRLERVLAQSPKNERALLLAARAARRSDAYADAEKYLTAFEEVERPTEASRLEWTLLGVQQGDFGEDEDRLRIAVGRNHLEESAILEALAKGYIAAERWPKAGEAVERLLARDPDHIPGLLLRAAAAERFRAADAAEKDLRRAIEKAPENAAAQSALAGLLSRRGYTRDAIYHFELALRLRPGHSATRLGLVRALLDNAELAEAERQLDELLKTDPDSVTALVERGRVALRRGQVSEAEQFVVRAVQLAPAHREANQFHLLILKDQNRSDALAACEKRLAESKAEDAEGGRLKLRARDTPSDSAIRMKLVEWAVRNGDREEEIAWLTEIMRIDAKHAGAHAAFADYFERANQPRRAALHREVAKTRGTSEGGSR